MIQIQNFLSNQMKNKNLKEKIQSDQWRFKTKRNEIYTFDLLNVLFVIHEIKILLIKLLTSGWSKKPKNLVIKKK